jgi:hypothetical protein
VVRKLFRAKYVDALRQAYADGQLRLPRGLSEADLEALLQKVATRVKWRTHFCEPYRHGEGVLTYLARYVKGGPIKNTQLLEDSGERIRFRYHDHRRASAQTENLSHDEFVRRVLWHVPEKGQHRVRYYGLYHAHKRPQRQACRVALAQAPEPEVPPEALDWQTFLARLGLTHHTTCPVCGAALIAAPLPPPAPHQHSPPHAHAA